MTTAILLLLFAHLEMPVSSLPQKPMVTMREQYQSPADIFARIIDERHVKWNEPLALPGNSLRDRIGE